VKEGGVCYSGHRIKKKMDKTKSTVMKEFDIED
jgi:hypothetical protein